MAEFKEEPRGVLVSMDTHEFSGASYVVWFPYTRTYITSVHEGDLVAVRSFAGLGDKSVFSILELVSVLPAHYALGTSSADAERAFPGFFLEAAKSARVDWEQEEPTEQTTKIKAEAIPTGIQLVFDSNKEQTTSPDESLPMIGEEAHLLSDDLTNQIINKGLLDGSVPTISPCKLVLNPAVEVRLSVEDLLKLHFGIFGFTGSGKSNLASTLVDSILGIGKPFKVCIFDLMAEYTGLMVDLLDKLDNAYLVVFGDDSLPGGDLTKEYLYGDEKKLDEAAKAIVRTMLLPKDLARDRQKFLPVIKRILADKKIKIFEEGAQATRVDDIRRDLEECIEGPLGNTKGPILEWIDVSLGGEGHVQVSKDEIRKMANDLNRFRRDGIPETFTASADTQTKGTQSTLGGRGAVSQTIIPLNATARGVFLRMIRSLENRIAETAKKRPEEAVLMAFDIQKILSDSKEPALLIFQSNRDNELREHAADVFYSIFNSRRRFGTIDPPVLFIFDEADEFIPGQKREDESYAQSKAAAATLARRGRKFGLGMGIATQRVAYLDTSILAQPHTYFISKMPREYDREALAKAFGVSDEMMIKTLKFSKGQWLLISYDATGIVNVPLPVQLRNANERILEYLESKKG